MERANVKKHEGLLTKKSHLSTCSGILRYRIYGSRENLGKKGRRQGSVRIDTRKNRFHEQRVFPVSSCPQVRCNRWKEGARAMLP